MPQNLESSFDTSTLRFAGLTRRIAARLIDWAFLLTLAFAIGLLGSVVMAVLRPNDFEAYIEYTAEFGVQNLNGQKANDLFNCDIAKNEESCRQAQSFSNDQTALILLTFVILSIFYFGILTSSKFQATLGKLWLKSKVVNKSGGRPTFWQALTREVFFILLFLSTALTLYLPQVQFAGAVLEMILLASCVKIILTPDKTAFHDNLAYTKVVLNN